MVNVSLLAKHHFSTAVPLSSSQTNTSGQHILQTLTHINIQDARSFPGNNTTTPAPASEYTEADYILLHRRVSSIYLIFAFAALLFNCNVFFSYIKMSTSKKTKKANLMFCIQSAVDLTVSLSFFLYSGLLQSFTGRVHEYGVSRPVYLMVVFFFHYTQLLAMTSLFLFTVERFIVVKFPFEHRSHVTRKRIVMAVMVNFAVSALPAFVYVVYIRDRMLQFTRYNITLAIISLIMIITVFLLLVHTYKAIQKSMRRSRSTERRQSRGLSQRVQLLRQRQSSESSQKYDDKRQIRILVILLVMFLLYSITFVPLAIWNIFAPFILHKGFMKLFPAHILNFIFIFLYHISGCVNPVITMTFIEDYRQTWLSYVSQKIFKRINYGNETPILQKKLSELSRITLIGNRGN